MLLFFFLIGFATVISWLLLCFFPPALWLIFCGGWGETTVQTKDWWWPWLFPRHGAPFSTQTWHIESLYVQMFYPLESLKVLGAPDPWDVVPKAYVLYVRNANSWRWQLQLQCCFKSHEIAGPTLAPVTEVCQLLDRWHEAAASMLRLKQLKCSKRDIYKVVPHS